MENSLDLVLTQNIADMQKELLVIFKNDDIILTNSAFNTFFGVNSLQEYRENFGPFIDNFVPHPSYFNAQKVQEGKSWFESILELNESDRVVSFLSQKHEPYAYSVTINERVQGYTIVTFEDITQSLIKRIMIENNASIDVRSGAYTKHYFLQIQKSYEEAAHFNEKMIALTLVELSNDEKLQGEALKDFTDSFKRSIRQDDMLVKWSDTQFLLAFLVDDAKRVQQVEKKLQSMLQKESTNVSSFRLISVLQQESEPIAKLLLRLSTMS